MKINDIFLQKLVSHINRKQWWHVIPRNPGTYSTRGKFLASSFREAEFWGRPLDEPQKVAVRKPLIGDEETIEKKLFGRHVSSKDITMEDRWNLDAKMRRAALSKGYDSIVLMSPKAYLEFRSTGMLPRSMELNVLSQDKGNCGVGVRNCDVFAREGTQRSGSAGTCRRGSRL